MENDVAMTFWEHLEELRRRIIICLICLGISTFIGLLFTSPLRYVLELPLNSPIINNIADMIESGAGEDGSILGFIALTLKAGRSNVEAELIINDPIDGIMAYLIIGITTGVLIAIPVLLYQVWMFIIPALKRSERRLALPLFFTILFFFILGAVFAHLIVVPVVLHFSADLFPELRNLWNYKSYIS
ncbi:preprotein translocase subunit TatC, partial [Candidatus Poribacteria bacterium]|nr:preprotein translocase subunit TatC [Candidatus Poribacteria bacterium]